MPTALRDLGLTTFRAQLDDLGLSSMTADGCLPCQQRAGTLAVADPPPPGADLSVTAWEGTIGMETELTGDGRLIELNALRWDDLPLPLRYVSSDVGAHDGAQVVGRILTIDRGQKGAITATGDFDMGSEAGREAARQVAEGLTTGVSMDLDDVSFEIRVAADVLEGDGPFMLPLFEEDMGEEAPEPETDEEGRVTVMEMKADDEVRVTTSGRIRAATIVAIPAFASAQIKLSGDLVVPAEPPATPALVAAAAPLEPPAAWFEDPHFTGPTALTFGDDGSVSGHLALWGTCHISYAQGGQCVTPPPSGSSYRSFHTGLIRTREGSDIPIGHITMDTGHAGESASPAVALAHYENTGAVAADVRVGEDAYGIWVAGALRPSVGPSQLRALRAAPLSGDWRRIGYDLELVAALSVNVPGYGVPRPAGLVAGGQVVSLVAAGMVAPRRVRRPGTPGALSTDDLRYLKRLADRERNEEMAAAVSGRLDAATELARRVRASALSMRVHRTQIGS